MTNVCKVHSSCYRFTGNDCSVFSYNMSHLMTKPTKWHVSPAKTQISLGIRPVWTESSLSALKKKAWVLSYPLSAQRRLWSDRVDAQANLSLRWVDMPLCWFCHEVAHICLWILFTVIVPLKSVKLDCMVCDLWPKEQQNLVVWT